MVVVDYGLSFNVEDDDITQTEETFRNRFLDLPETNTPGGDRRDPRSDLTAVCAILFFCLTGRVPGQLQDGMGKLPHLREGLSLRDIHDDERVPRLLEFFSRGFAPNIANRFQTVDEITEVLDGLISLDTDVDESDPVQLAAQLSTQLRAGDRTTQLEEFRTHAKALFKYIDNQTLKYHQKLGRFSVVKSPSGFGGGRNTFHMPPGLDLVEHFHGYILIQAQHHKQQKHRRYAVASRGEQCVLLAADSNFTGKRTMQIAVQQNCTWQEVAWFEGNPESINSLVAVHYRDWVTTKLNELAAEILSKTI